MSARLKSFVFIDTIWFDNSVKFPRQFLDGYTLHNYETLPHPFKEVILQWGKQNNISANPLLIIEINKLYEQNLLQAYWSSIQQIFVIIRLLNYNRVFVKHILNFHGDRITSCISSDKPRPSYSSDKSEIITSEKLYQIEELIKIYNTVFLNNKRNKRIYFSLHFWNSSSCSANFENRVVDLFTALEGLFTTDNSEVSYKLANRMAWFLFPNFDSDHRLNRMEVFKAAKEGYKVRSNVVHGKKFVDTTDMESISIIHSQTRDILLKILYDKKLIDVFTSDNKKLDEYFNALVHGFLK